MPTNRELFFRYQKEGIPTTVILFALQQINAFSHAQLTLNFDKEINNYPYFCEAMKRYQNGEMIEYIFESTHFLSKVFYVNKKVLIPRQETEQLVLLSIGKTINKFGANTLTIADICTGSGVIGISMALDQPQHNYYLVDIDDEAIRVAEENIRRFGVSRCQTMIGDMLQPLLGRDIKLDVLVCNPPYIEDISSIDKRTWNQEPHLALLATPSTKYYEIIFRNVDQIMNEQFLLCFEIGEDMEEELIALVKKYFPEAKYSFEKDLYGKTRFLFVENKD
ncbi:MAG: HemK family protein methyltransferase [Erysipelotrichaceae bacterium]|jgi:release factor glutamine methyltransferase|nr:HemK family protein methyltransferase [Erysipelotrichaceae bacterium]